MNVVVSSSRGDDRNVDVGSDAIQISEKSGKEIFRNRRSAFLGAEDAMNQDIRICVRHKCRPFGTRSSWLSTRGLRPGLSCVGPSGLGFAVSGFRLRRIGLPGAYAPGFPVLALRAWTRDTLGLPFWRMSVRLNQVQPAESSQPSVAISNAQSLCAVSRRNCSVL